MEKDLTLKAEFLFEFKDFEQWVNKASSWFTPYTRYDKTVCLDINGRACTIGEDFMKARDENLFPVKAYRLTRTVEANYTQSVV